MKRLLLGSIALTFATACGSSTPPAEAPAEPTVTAAPAPEPAPEPQEPTAEEKKATEAQRRLEADRAALASEHSAEVARLTPEILAEGKAIADKSYPSGRAAIQATLAGRYRKPGNPERDKARHPLETLEVFGFSPTQTVLEYGPGEGWYTELLAPALAKKGKLLVTTADPNGPASDRATFYAERTKLFIDKAPDLYGKIEPVVVDTKAPNLDLDQTVDLVLVIRGLHGIVNSGTLPTWLAEIHTALKPKGVLGIVQHRAKPDAVPTESSKLGYLPEKWVIEQVEAAGFKLVTKSEINANPKDTKDYPEGVWALPPSFRNGDRDHDKYAAIGESDRMTLKFVKVAQPAAPAAK